MIYPKEFEKRASVATELAEKAVQPLIKGVKRVLRLKDIATHSAPVIAPGTEIIQPQDQQQPSPVLYIDDKGRAYPSVFGYQLPIVPRRLAPIIRNLPSGDTI